MLFMLKVFTLFLACLSASPLVADTAKKQKPEQKSHTIELLVIDGVLDDLPALLQDDTLLTFDNFNRPGVRRDIIDYILLRQALHIGLTLNQRTDVEVKEVSWYGSSYNRLLSSLQFGQYTLYSHTVWREDFLPGSNSNPQFPEAHKNLYITSPTLKFGEFEAGLYMNPDNPKMASFELSNMRAVSSRQWRPDWQALSQLPLKQLYSGVNFENMLKMVRSQRVDFTLIPFTREPDLSYSAIGIDLMPVHGVKVSLAGSRGWAISRSHPSGKIAYDAIERGLVELRKQGAIARAYTEAGFINSSTADWKILNADTNLKKSTDAQVSQTQPKHQ